LSSLSSSSSSSECGSDAHDCRDDDKPTYLVHKVARGDLRTEIESPQHPTTSICRINNISKQEILLDIRKPRQRIPMNDATIAALSGQRRSITSSPWTCLEDSHHPLCPGDCDIGLVAESGNNNAFDTHTAASAKSSLTSSSSPAPVDTDDQLPQKHDYTWLDSPPVLVRQRVKEYAVTTHSVPSDHSPSTTRTGRTHRRNKDVLCAPRTSTFWTTLYTSNINQLSPNCPYYSSLTQSRRGDTRGLLKFLDRHPKAAASSLCFENAEEFEVYLRLGRS